MKQNNIFISIHPDKRRIKKNGVFPLKLRITYKGTRKYYATGHNADIRNWNLIEENKSRGDLKKNGY
jgi:hypothetical protein